MAVAALQHPPTIPALSPTSDEPPTVLEDTGASAPTAVTSFRVVRSPAPRFGPDLATWPVSATGEEPKWGVAHPLGLPDSGLTL